MKVEYHEDGSRIVKRSNTQQRSGTVELMDCDGKTGLFFHDRVSAGVEIPALDFSKNQKLVFKFSLKVLNLAEKGKCVFCSFGDRIPVRLALPANRRDTLYAYTLNQWQPVGRFTGEDWEQIEVVFGKTHFEAALAGSGAKRFENPILNPNPRLYLADGFESEYLPNNEGSEFVVDIASIKTAVIS
jgi:hypothetical protein